MSNRNFNFELGQVLVYIAQAPIFRLVRSIRHHSKLILSEAIQKWFI